MNKSFFKTIFLSIALFIAMPVIFCVDTSAEQIEAAFGKVNELLAITKANIMSMQAKKESIVDKILTHINNGNEDKACKKVNLIEFQKYSLLFFYPALSQVVQDKLISLEKELLLGIIRAADLKQMSSVITKIMYMPGFVNPSLIEKLIKNGDADMLKCLLQNGLVKKMYYPIFPDPLVAHGEVSVLLAFDMILYNMLYKSAYPTLPELQELAAQHNQENVVAVLKPYVEASEKSWLSSFFPASFFCCSY